MELGIVRNLKPVQLTSTDQAYLDLVFLSERTIQRLLSLTNMPKDSPIVYIKIKGMVFTAGKLGIQDSEIALGKLQRGFLKIGLTDTVDVFPFAFAQDEEKRLSNLHLELDPKLLLKQSKLEIDEKEITTSMKKLFKDHVYQPGVSFLLDYFGNAFEARVLTTELVDIGVKTGKPKSNVPGIIAEETDIEFSVTTNDKVTIKGNASKAVSLFKTDFTFESLGIGGLDIEISNIFRQAFASRRFPPAALKKYGINHVKGVLLYGPPGTGKTLMARQLSKALRSKEPKIVNGPELFDKYVGETEKKIRDLFADAIADQKQNGETSDLHVIIFDEFDSICRQRGSITSGTGVQDSAVNQLLAMMDGVDSLNNILLIGMTNRKDMLDEAVLRPGRFEVHVEVGLPNEAGRLQIFKIHTKQMMANKLLHENVDLATLAKLTKNYTGAEIEAVVKRAASFAFHRGNDITDFSKKIDINNLAKLEMQDFMLALEEVKPQFGADTDRFELYLRGGIIPYGGRLKKVQDTLKNTMDQLRNSRSQQLVSILLEGDVGCGKTALASWAATTSEFPYIKVITSDNMLGLSDIGKINQMVKIFEDAYRTQLAVIVLDDIERLIEYVETGARFSNQILQTLMVLIKRIPTKVTNKLVVLGTSSSIGVLKDVGLASAFNFMVPVPTLSTREEIKAILTHYRCSEREANAIADSIKSITIKKLTLILEMSRQDGSEITFDSFTRCYHNYMD